MNDKKSFVLYANYREQLDLLSMEQRGVLFTAILNYVAGGELPDMDSVTNMCFAFIKAQLDRDNEKYAAICEKRAEAGRLGGRPRKAEKQTEAKKAKGFSEKQKNPDNVNDNEDDNVNDNEDSISNISCPPDGERKQKSDILEKQKSDFEKIYAIYPKKQGKAKAFELYRAYTGKGRTVSANRYKLDRNQIWKAVRRFVDECEAEGRQLEYYPMFSTFMNKQILDYLPTEKGGGENGSSAEIRRPASDYYKRFLGDWDDNVSEKG